MDSNSGDTILDTIFKITGLVPLSDIDTGLVYEKNTKKTTLPDAIQTFRPI